MEENRCDAIKITLDDDIVAPIYVYYQLDNFYQNHRRYVKSRSNEQLLGNNLALDAIETDCEPIKTNADIGFNKTVDGTANLNMDAVAYPCGLVAKSFFNDTYSITKDSPTGDSVDINSDDIAWKSDRDFKFKNLEGDW